MSMVHMQSEQGHCFQKILDPPLLTVGFEKSYFQVVLKILYESMIDSIYEPANLLRLLTRYKQLSQWEFQMYDILSYLTISSNAMSSDQKMPLGMFVWTKHF